MKSVSKYLVLEIKVPRSAPVVLSCILRGAYVTFKQAQLLARRNGWELNERFSMSDWPAAATAYESPDKKGSARGRAQVSNWAARRSHVTLKEEASLRTPKKSGASALAAAQNFEFVRVCPFCGASPERNVDDARDGVVACKAPRCRAQPRVVSRTGANTAARLRHAIKLWNKRPKQESA